MSSDTHLIGKRALRKAERRQAFVDAARASFLERGYANTSMSALLDTLGGSKATLWSYFRSKEDLFAAVIDDVTEAFRVDALQALQPDRGLGRTLETFCRGLIEVTQSEEGFATWRLLTSESARSPEIGRIFYERAVLVVEDAVHAVLDHAVASGQLIPRPTAEMAMVLLNMCTGRQQGRVWGRDAAMSPAQEARVYVEVFLRAYGACARATDVASAPNSPE